MILIKDNAKREFEDLETIKIFKDAGWVEFKEVKKPVETKTKNKD